MRGFSGLNAAEAAKDLEKRISFYAEDGEGFAAGLPDIRGTAALLEEWRKYLSAAGTFQWNTPKVEVSSVRDLAYQTGGFVLNTIDKNGQHCDKIRSVGEKQRDRRWKSRKLSIIPTASPVE
jgi:ketosteroid isomerase-like protein